MRANPDFSIVLSFLTDAVLARLEVRALSVTHGAEAPCYLSLNPLAVPAEGLVVVKVGS